MKYLVTGGAGFIGSHLVEALVRDGHAVRVLDNFSTGRRENLAAVPGAQLEIIEGDIRDAALLSRCASEVDGIFHQAALVSVQESIERPDLSADINARSTVNVLQAARAAGVKRVVLASSAAVYGDNPNLPLRESEPPSPLSPYGLDKLYGEKAGEVYHALFGMYVAALRYFNVYGPRQRPDSPYSGVISIFMDAVSRGRPVTIYGDGGQSRDFVHVQDVVQANRLAMQVPLTGYQVFNVANGQSVALKELLDLVWLTLDRKTGIAYAPARPQDIRHSRADIGRIRAALGYRSRWTLREGLRALASGRPDMQPVAHDPQQGSGQA
ncbi:MAG: NAD-dependent epimerase/dehydratase family protein [Gammaproteobacteria bacterium]|nr:MAG: NAD-dependent epimerase/dehydratase family protein [Gammaproteobacteria bacterium]